MLINFKDQAFLLFNQYLHKVCYFHLINYYYFIFVINFIYIYNQNNHILCNILNSLFILRYNIKKPAINYEI
jgi:hypothetical protein